MRWMMLVACALWAFEAAAYQWPETMAHCHETMAKIKRDHELGTKYMNELHGAPGSAERRRSDQILGTAPPRPEGSASEHIARECVKIKRRSKGRERLAYQSANDTPPWIEDRMRERRDDDVREYWERLERENRLRRMERELDIQRSDLEVERRQRLIRERGSRL